MSTANLLEQIYKNIERGWVSIGVNLSKDVNGGIKKVPKGRGWQHNTLQNCVEKFLELTKATYKPVNGLGVLTGGRSQITIVDYDSYKDDPLFDTTKFKDLFYESTFSVKTISGGKHFYFKYCPDLQQTQGKKIDIRNDGGMAICNPTEYNNKKYTIDSDIPVRELTSAQLNFINDYLFPKKTVRESEENCPDSGDFGEIIKRCLECLDDDMRENRADWCKVAFVIKLHLGEIGYPLLLEWSKGSSMFKDEKWIRGQFNSIKAKGKDNKTSNFLNIGWLKKRARFQNPNLYFNTIDNGEFSIDRMEDIADGSTNPVEEAVKYFNKYHYKIVDQGIKYAVVESDRVFVYTKGNLEERYGNANVHYVDESGKKKKTNIVKAWLEYKKMNIVKGIGFEPDFKNVKLKTSCGRINIWRGGLHAYDENHQPDMSKCQPWLDHIREVWCDDKKDLYHFTIGRLAILFQRPTFRCPVNIVVKGLMGSGKSFVTDFIGSNVLGDRFYSYYSDMVDFLDGFNSEQEQCLLNVLDEINSGGAAYKQSDKLKSMTTRKKKNINNKYGAKYDVADYSSMVFLTNNETIHRVEQGDRRYLMLESSNHRVGDDQYFTELAKLDTLDAGYEFFHYLMNYDLSKFNPQKIPVSNWKLISMLANITPVTYCVIDWLHQRWGGDECPENTTEDIELDTDSLWCCFCLRYGQIKHTQTRYKFMHQVSSFLGMKANCRKRVSGKIVRVYKVSCEIVYDLICKALKVDAIDEVLDNFDDLSEKAGDSYMKSACVV